MVFASATVVFVAGAHVEARRRIGRPPRRRSRPRKTFLSPFAKLVAGKGSGPLFSDSGRATRRLRGPRRGAWSGFRAASSRWGASTRVTYHTAARRHDRRPADSSGLGRRILDGSERSDQRPVRGASSQATELRDGRRAHTRQPRSFPARRRKTSSPARSCSRRRRSRCRSTIITGGGAT